MCRTGITYRHITCHGVAHYRFQAVLAGGRAAGESALQFLETNDFKQLPHLTLAFRPGCAFLSFSHLMSDTFCRGCLQNSEAASKGSSLRRGKCFRALGLANVRSSITRDLQNGCGREAFPGVPAGGGHRQRRGPRLRAARYKGASKTVQLRRWVQRKVNR